MKGQWKFNTKKYNKVVAYLLFVGVQAGLFAIGFIVFSPILLILGKNTYTNFAYFNLSVLISSYMYSAWTLRVLSRL
jgi:uncharacterized membrane protein